MAPSTRPSLVLAATALAWASLAGCELFIGGPSGAGDDAGATAVDAGAQAGPDAGGDAGVDGGVCVPECLADATECLAGARTLCITGADGCRTRQSVACPEKMIDWVPVSGGAFQMGSAYGNSDERPVHAVTVGDLQVTRTEITVAQYAGCFTAGACTSPGGGSNANSGAAYDLYPVNYVSWHQAVGFCGWAGGRLPTEAEWESLAGGHRAYLYPWGAQAPSCSLALYDSPGGGGDGCGSARSAPVCSRPAGNSPEGLCDLAGNVWEWTQDWYHPSYSGAPGDGSAWLAPETTTKALRGAGVYNPDYWLRVSARLERVPALQADDVGFRCVR